MSADAVSIPDIWGVKVEPTSQISKRRRYGGGCFGSRKGPTFACFRLLEPSKKMAISVDVQLANAMSLTSSPGYGVLGMVLVRSGSRTKREESQIREL